MVSGRHCQLNEKLEFDVQLWAMTDRDRLYRRHRFPAEIIAHGVWRWCRDQYEGAARSLMGLVTLNSPLPLCNGRKPGVQCQASG